MCVTKTKAQDQESSPAVPGTVGLKAVFLCAADEQKTCSLFNQSMVRQRQRGQTAPGSVIYLTFFSLVFLFPHSQYQEAPEAPSD